MNELRRLPVGIQTFEDIRKNNLLYIDKTEYLAQLVLSGFKSVFLSRPHRFGKSLFLSTLKSYFEGKKELFKGLYIEQVEPTLAQQLNREPWEVAPVLYFDFNAKDYFSPSTLHDRLSMQLDLLEAKFGIEKRYEAPDDRLIYLITRISQEKNKQVVILVDEYDKPLLETVNDETLNAGNRAQLKAFYEVLKQCDQYIRFALLTGITKFSKTTLFSGVNNLVDITLLNDYANICGFTEEELTQYLTPEIQRLAALQDESVEQTRATLI